MSRDFYRGLLVVGVFIVRVVLLIAAVVRSYHGEFDAANHNLLWVIVLSLSLPHTRRMK